MPFPTYDAFGGFHNLTRRFATRRKVDLRPPKSLDELNRGVTRIIDVYAPNYAALVRGPGGDSPRPGPFAPNLSPRQKETRVAIIGAGMAGLCALYELTRCGLKPILFEASGRIGGRCYDLLLNRRFRSALP